MTGDHQTLRELRRNAVAAACMIATITLGAFLLMTVLR
jgi:hypothetical protein